MGIKKVVYFMDTVLLSVSNLCITFVLLSGIDGAFSVEVFGVSQALALIFISLNRALFITPYNSDICQNKSVIAVVDQIALNVLVLLVASFLVFLVVDLVVFITFFCYYVFAMHHEVFRVFYSDKPYYYRLLFGSCVVFFLTFLGFSFGFMSIRYAQLIFFISFLVSFFVFMSSLSYKNILSGLVSYFSNFRIRFYLLFDFRSFIGRFNQSISQNILVNVPVLVVSSLYGSITTSYLVVARSVFQPSQILVRTLEVFDQKEISNKIRSGKELFIINYFLRYVFLSFVFVALCFLLAKNLMPLLYAAEDIPPFYYIFSFGLIMIFLAGARVFEMYFYATYNYFYVYFSYFLSGIFVLSMLFFYTPKNPSIFLMVGWLIMLKLLIVFYVFNFRKSLQ